MHTPLVNRNTSIYKEERKFDNSPVTKQINVTSTSNRIKQEKEKEGGLQDG